MNLTVSERRQLSRAIPDFSIPAGGRVRLGVATYAIRRPVELNYEHLVGGNNFVLISLAASTFNAN